MSNHEFAFIQKSKVPSREAWQEAITRAGFDFELDPSLTPFVDSGYRPCKLSNVDAGFEIDYSPAAEVVADAGQLAVIAPGRDYCITMRWGGDMRDCAAVLISSYALAKDFDAKISYEGDAPETLESLLAQVQEAMEYAKNDS